MVERRSLRLLTLAAVLVICLACITTCSATRVNAHKSVARRHAVLRAAGLRRAHTRVSASAQDSTVLAGDDETDEDEREEGDGDDEEDKENQVDEAPDQKKTKTPKKKGHPKKGTDENADDGAKEEDKEEREAEREEKKEGKKASKAKAAEKDSVEFEQAKQQKSAPQRPKAKLVRMSKGIIKHGKLYCPSHSKGGSTRLLHCPHVDGACCPTLNMCCRKGLKCAVSLDNKPQCVLHREPVKMDLHPNIIIKVPGADDVGREGITAAQKQEENDDAKADAVAKDKKLEAKEEGAPEDPAKEDKAGGSELPAPPKHNSDFGLSLRLRNRNVFEGSPAPTIWPDRARENVEGAAFKRSNKDNIPQGREKKFAGFNNKKMTMKVLSEEEKQAKEEEREMVVAAEHRKQAEAKKKAEQRAKQPRPKMNVVVNANRLHHHRVRED